MKLEISTWTHHLNQLLYSYFYYCKSTKTAFNLVFNKNVRHNGAVLFIENKSAFFDYSDDVLFLDSTNSYDYYFKRSLKEEDVKANVHTLNFNLLISYKSHSFLLNLNRDFFRFKPNRMEIFRALDKYALLTNSAHGIIDSRKLPLEVNDHGGNIIFHTRLWNAENHPNEEEKYRRRLQNDFRINACRILKNNFENVSVGLFSDKLSQELAPDILLDNTHSKKKNYLKNLKGFNIGVADDGLKDTPGWKIGEYLLFGKAVITTPINVTLDHFIEGVNYEKLSSRSAYEDIPERVENLLKNKKYLEVGKNNLDWSNKYLHPKNYFERIITIINSDTVK
ncbi:hypothetical protein [Lacinutrix jangbogonensis]|uniref:hypothetical protein n=1 Tax=Lacinutrix jangbogonensis TaxID=1469557 RepID=UPI00053EAB96|nr:hypothetical protein [Lacinutrix jangbogonensis]